MTWQLTEIAKMCMGTLIGEDLSVENLYTDTRKPMPDGVFLAIVGENYDAHDFVDKAFAGGARCAIINKSAQRQVQNRLRACVSLITVDDTQEAFLTWAKNWRKKISAKIIAISGSNGKTSSKEMLATILSNSYGADNIIYTAENLNNHLGVPQTILKIRPNHRVAVIEIGINQLNEMEKLAQVVAPDIALITKAGSAHLHTFGTTKIVASEKAKLYNYLQPNGVAVINADDEHSHIFTNAALNHRKKYFSINNSSAKIISVGEKINISCDYQQKNINIELPTPAVYQGMNALAVIAICEELVIDKKIVINSLNNFKNMRGRLQIIKTPNVNIINDAYNANPDSMRAAITTLKSFQQPRILILGDMGELGVGAERFHKEILNDIDDIDSTILLGTAFGKAFNQLSEEFSNNKNIYFCESFILAKEKYLQIIKSHITINPNVKITCLFKASRFMKFEGLIKLFLPNEFHQQIGDFH